MSRGSTWNRFRYTLGAPIYDRVAAFAGSRRRSLELLDVKPEETVLLIGAPAMPIIPGHRTPTGREQSLRGS